MRPSSASSAAPTRNPENGAWARNRTSRAAFTSASDMASLSRAVGQHDAGDGCVEDGGEEPDEECAAAKPGEVRAARRGHRADAAELDADGAEVGEPGQGVRRQHVGPR